MARIVAGLAGGRRLAVPRHGTRPTTERVREALFSAVESAMGGLSGARVLDLFAGSGALGLEALSRGAATATFVESDRGALAVLAKNIATIGLPGAEVRGGSVGAVLSDPGAEPYDLVLADPPYRLGGDELHAMLVALAGNGWTAAGALVVVERAARSQPPRWPEPLRALRVRRYGDTELHWARHADTESDSQS